MANARCLPRTPFAGSRPEAALNAARQRFRSLSTKELKRLCNRAEWAFSSEKFVRTGGLDKLRKKEKLCHLSAGKAASNTDVERWVTFMLRRSCHGMGHRALCAARPRWASLSLASAGVLRADDQPAGENRRTPSRLSRESPAPSIIQTLRDWRGPAVVLDLRARTIPSPKAAPRLWCFSTVGLPSIPGFYGAWIDHLVRDGKIVIFPRYQNDVGTHPQDFLPNAMAAIRDALGVLGDGVGHVRARSQPVCLDRPFGRRKPGGPDRRASRLTRTPTCPSPRRVIAAMPGEIVPIREPSLASIAPSTLLIVMVGEEDVVVGDLRGRQIFAQATAIPLVEKAIRLVPFRSARLPAIDRRAHGAQRRSFPARQRRGCFPRASSWAWRTSTPWTERASGEWPI